MIRMCVSFAFSILLASGAAVQASADRDRPDRSARIEQVPSRPSAPPREADKPVETAPEENVRKPVLDELFARLAAAKDQEEADGIAGAIERVFRRSGSDTADLLMGRALTALQRKENKIAIDVLDKLVVIEPDWAEAWSQRAAARYIEGDRAGAVEDLGHALSREPRHFNALAGLGSALYSLGFEKRALEVFRRAIAVRPHQSDIKKMIDKLAPDVDGRDI